MKKDHIGFQKIHAIWFSFCILGEIFTGTFEYKQLLFARSWLSSKKKTICFWFETMKIDWIWRKVFERLITLLNVSLDIIQVLFFQVSLHSKFKRFFIEELKITKVFNKVYAPIYS